MLGEYQPRCMYCVYLRHASPGVTVPVRTPLPGWFICLRCIAGLLRTISPVQTKRKWEDNLGSPLQGGGGIGRSCHKEEWAHSKNLGHGDKNTLREKRKESKFITDNKHWPALFLSHSLLLFLSTWHQWFLLQLTNLTESCCPRGLLGLTKNKITIHWNIW